MPKPVGNESRYNPAIDGIRTLAVLAVILYHMDVPQVPGGLLGVGVFFTISGYLITGNLMRSWNSRGNLGLSTFWLRRLRRLMPAVIVTVLVVWAITPFAAPEQWHDHFFAGWTAIFYINNWATIMYGDSYFDQFSRTPFEHMWSLSVEEQFYLFWPLILLLILLISRGHKAITLTLTTILAGASFAWIAYAFHAGMDVTRIYEGTDTRAGALLVGALLAIALSSRPTPAPSAEAGTGTAGNTDSTDSAGCPNSVGKTGSFTANPGPSTAVRAFAGLVGLVSFAGIVGMFVLVADSSPFLFNVGTVVLSLLTAGLLFAVVKRGSVIYQIFGFRPFAWVGERSYAIYLWHMPIIAFLYDPLKSLPLWAATAIVTVSSIVLAALSWVLVEDPIRRNGFFPPLVRWVRRQNSAPRPLWSLPIAFLLGATLIGVPASMAYEHNQQVLAQQAAEQAAQRAQQQRQAAEDAKKLAEEQRQAAQLAATTTRCHEIVHVGDSTSLAMFTDAGVLTPEDNATVTYESTGATKVVNSSFGARATNQGFEDYPSGNQSLLDILAGGVDPDTCFVIALGINDAANMNVEGADNSSQHIAATMDIIGPDYPVMWVTAVVNPQGSPRWYEPRVMTLWNEALFILQNRYPNMWVYTWDQEVRSDWFLKNDGVHYNAVGNSQRSQRFAQAVINAWPMTLERNNAPLLPKPPLPSMDRVVTGERPAGF